jgi:hypothetical protein
MRWRYLTWRWLRGSCTLRPGTLDSVRERLESTGTPVIDPPAGAAQDGVWLRDPDGTAVQLLDEPPAPARPIAEVLANVGATAQRIGVAQWRRATDDVLPRRLGHTLLFTPQPQRMTDGSLASGRSPRTCGAAAAGDVPEQSGASRLASRSLLGAPALARTTKT